MEHYTINYHGLWEAYTPDYVPDEQLHVLFCRRVGDGVDFFQNRSEFVVSGSCNFTADLVGGYYVIRGASTNDVPSYPAGRHYFTIMGWDRPYEELLRYRVNANTFQIEPIPEVVDKVERVSARQFKLQLYADGLLDTVDHWVESQSREIQLAYANSATFEVGDTMLNAGFDALGFNAEQVKAFFEAASKI